MKAKIQASVRFGLWDIVVYGAVITRMYGEPHTEAQLRAYARRWLKKHMPNIEIEEE